MASNILRGLIRPSTASYCLSILAARRGYSAASSCSPSTKVTTLANGMRVATDERPGQSATVGVWIDAGSRFETDKDNGVAHFLEHMAFKGTSRRTQEQLEVEVENMGGHLNAYTSREQTVYYAKVLKGDVPQAVDILADILQNSMLDEAQIERERGVILREMQEVESQVEEVVFDNLHASAYHGTPLARTILGPKNNIQSIGRADLKRYITNHYTAPRMVLAGAGAIDHKELVSLAEKLFANLPTKAASESAVDHSPAKFTGSDIRVVDDSKTDFHFALAFEGVGWSNPDSFSLMVMQSILGSWDRSSGAGKHASSSLCQELAKSGVCNSIMSFNTCYSDTGLFGLYGVGDVAGMDDYLWIVMYELARLAHNVSDSEVIRARNQLKAQLQMQLDGSSAICEDIGRQMLTYGRRLSTEELFARIDAVTVDSVKATANRYINDCDLVFSSVGPYPKGKYLIPDYTWLRRRTYWLRY